MRPVHGITLQLSAHTGAQFAGGAGVTVLNPVINITAARPVGHAFFRCAEDATETAFSVRITGHNAKSYVIVDRQPVRVAPEGN
jgi:hypothetical protein